MAGRGDAEDEAARRIGCVRGESGGWWKRSAVVLEVEDGGEAVVLRLGCQHFQFIESG